MTPNETSFDPLKSIIAEDIEARLHLIKYIKNYGKFTKKSVNLSVFADAIELR